MTHIHTLLSESRAESHKFLWQVLDIDKEHKDCLTRCIRLLLKVGREKEALGLSSRAAALYPEDDTQLYLHAICLRLASWLCTYKCTMWTYLKPTAEHDEVHFAAETAVGLRRQLRSWTMPLSSASKRTTKLTLTMT